MCFYTTGSLWYFYEKVVNCGMPSCQALSQPRVSAPWALGSLPLLT